MCCGHTGRDLDLGSAALSAALLISPSAALCSSSSTTRPFLVMSPTSQSFCPMRWACLFSPQGPPGSWAQGSVGWPALGSGSNSPGLWQPALISLGGESPPLGRHLAEAGRAGLVAGDSHCPRLRQGSVATVLRAVSAAPRPDPVIRHTQDCRPVRGRRPGEASALAGAAQLPGKSWAAFLPGAGTGGTGPCPPRSCHSVSC